MIAFLFMCGFLTWPLWGLKVSPADLHAIRTDRDRRTGYVWMVLQ